MKKFLGALFGVVVALSITIGYAQYQSGDGDTRAEVGIAAVQVDVGDASTSTLGDLFSIVGDPAANSITTTVEDTNTDTAAILTDTSTTLPGEHTTIITDVAGVQTDTTALLVDTAAIIVDTGTDIPASFVTTDAAIAAVQATADAIEVDTGTDIPASFVTTDAAIAAVQVTADAIEVDTGTDIPASFVTTDAAIAVVDGNVDAILLDTIELQTDWTNGGRLDLILDAIDTTTTSISGDTDQIDGAIYLNGGTLTGGAHTTTQIVSSDLTQGDDYYNGMLIVVIDESDGDGVGTARRVTDFDSGTDKLFLDRALPFTPIDGDTFSIVSGDTKTQDDVAAILVDTGTDIPASFVTTDAAIAVVDTVVDTINTNLGDPSGFSPNNIADILGNPGGSSYAAVLGNLSTTVGDTNTAVVLETATLDTGGHTSTSVISSTLTQSDDYWIGAMVTVVDDDGFSQSRAVIDFDAITNALTLDSALGFTPINDDEIVLTAANTLWGVPGVASTTNTALGLVGDPLDADIASGVEGSLFGHINDTQTDTTALIGEIPLTNTWGDGAGIDASDGQNDIYDAVAGSVTAVNRQAGRMQVFTVNETTLADNAVANVTVAAAQIAALTLESVVVYANEQLDTGENDFLVELTCGDVGGENEIFSTTDYVEANLNALSEQIEWVGSLRLEIGDLCRVRETVGGGDGDTQDVDIVFHFRADADGAYLQ